MRDPGVLGAGVPSAPPSGQVLREAALLARDGEIGSSNAIRLVQLPHTPAELKEVLRRYDAVLTREARGKLALEAWAPLPANVENQRWEPIFDRYPISGRLYTTASGTVVLDEVQYYNGVMVQVYGECADVGRVRAALAGSGYRPLTLRHADGRETAVAHVWAHNLSDTSLWPYNAMFLIVAAVPDDTPAHRASLAADENGVSSVLSVVDGAYDAARGVYENRARFLYLRLLDSTRVAIEVGRERMGTDKRPGTIDITRRGEAYTFAVRDGIGRGVVRVDVVPTADPAALRPAIAQAAATAGVPCRDLRAGTELVFPGVARIGDGPVVTWDWRTDVTPRLQRVAPDSVFVDPSSELGADIAAFGFRPKVLGFLSHVRGVVTGVPAQAPSRRLDVRIRAAHGPVTLRPR